MCPENPENVQCLIAAYLAGSLSAREQLRLARLLRENPEVKQTLAEMVGLMALAAKTGFEKEKEENLRMLRKKIN